MLDDGLRRVMLEDAFFEHPAPWHSHAVMQALVVVEGALSIRFEGQEPWLLEPGQAMIIPADLPHMPGPGDEDRRALILALYISGEPANSLAHWLLSQPMPRRWRCNPGVLDAAVRQLAALAASPTRIDRPSLMHAVWGLFISNDLAACGVAPGQDPPPDPDAGIDKRVLYIESIMRAWMSSPYDAKGLARSTQISVSQMNRLFQHHRGVSPLRRMQAIRLDRARHYLANSTLTVQEIAERCGFINSIHFTKLFKDTFEQTPREYRRLQTPR